VATLIPPSFEAPPVSRRKKKTRKPSTSRADAPDEPPAPPADFTAVELDFFRRTEELFPEDPAPAAERRSGEHLVN
jgi:hypothetical protein